MDAEQQRKEFIGGMKLLSKPANGQEAQESRHIIAEALAALPDDKIVKLCQLAKEEQDALEAMNDPELKVLPFFANECAPLLPPEMVNKLGEMNYIIFNIRVSGMVRELMRKWDGWKQPPAAQG